MVIALSEIMCCRLYTIKLFEWISMHWLLVPNRKVLSCLGENNDCSDGMTPTSSISQNERIFDGAMVLGNIQRKQESPWTWKIANWLVGRVGLVGLHGVGWWVASHFFMEMNQCMLEIVRDQKGLLNKSFRILLGGFGRFNTVDPLFYLWPLLRGGTRSQGLGAFQNTKKLGLSLRS